MENLKLENLYEAYMQVYEPQELTEEIEIAAEYFYEMGLNEDGLDILIEELGLDEFVEFVYDIAEEYSLMEAETRLQATASRRSNKILRGPKGSKPQSTTKARIKSQGGLTMSSTQRPSSTISKRNRAVSKATSQQSDQPQSKPGLMGRIGSALNYAGERAKKDIALTRQGLENVGKTWQKVSDTKAAQRARIGVTKASKSIEKHAPKVGRSLGRIAGQLASKSSLARDIHKFGTRVNAALSNEEYETILYHLINEGYASDEKSAEGIFHAMSEEWMYEILDEAEIIGNSKKSLFGTRFQGVTTPPTTKKSSDTYNTDPNVKKTIDAAIKSGRRTERKLTYEIR